MLTPLLFLASGFSALLYQVVWQRALFGVFGVDIESVTIIVTAFMLGLGIGSLLGGRLSKNSLSKNPERSALQWFGVMEVAIGLFGIVSLPVLAAVGALSWSLPPALAAVLTFVTALVPTTLMGATLPLLVADRVRRSGNAAESVGTLYFTNTLGSAFASFISVAFLLRFVGATGTTYLAASINLVVGAGALLVARSRS